MLHAPISLGLIYSCFVEVDTISKLQVKLAARLVGVRTATGRVGLCNGMKIFRPMMESPHGGP